MINTADNLPAAAEQETDSSNPHHLPGEIFEKILLNLPLKSLVSFTSVSTSWRSTIHSLIAAAEPRKLLVINDNPSHFDVWSACTAPLSAVSENLPLTAASELVCPFRAEAKLMAFCDELWCVVDRNFLYLWNPSTGEYKELADMPPDPRQLGTGVEVVYGLGYNPVDDDFKLLRIWRHGGGLWPSRTMAIDPDEECGSSNSVEGGFIDPDAGSSSGSVQSGFLDPTSSTRRVRGGFVHTESFVSPKKWELR